MRTDSLPPESTYDLRTAFKQWCLDRRDARVLPTEEDIVEFFQEYIDEAYEAGVERMVKINIQK